MNFYKESENFMGKLFEEFANCKFLGQKYDVFPAEDKTIIVFEAVGIREDDIILDTVYDKDAHCTYLTVVGETYIKELNKTYKINNQFPIDVRDYKEINYKIQNGLLIIDLLFDSPDVFKVKINRK